MKTDIAEIAEGIWRFSTYVPEIAPPMGFTFNQFLVGADEPFLFHCGPRAMFPLVSAAVASVMPLDRLRWISFGHVESDECGAMNLWLAAAPDAQVVHGQTACMVSLNDLADRPPRALAHGETLDLGRRHIRWLDTPHVPHGWEAGVVYEETDQDFVLRRPLHPSGQRPRRHQRQHPRTRHRGGRSVSGFSAHAFDRAHHPHAGGVGAGAAGGDAWLELRRRLRHPALPSRRLLRKGARLARGLTRKKFARRCVAHQAGRA